MPETSHPVQKQQKTKYHPLLLREIFCTACLQSELLWVLHNYFLPIKLNQAKQKISFSAKTDKQNAA